MYEYFIKNKHIVRPSVWTIMSALILHLIIPGTVLSSTGEKPAELAMPMVGTMVQVSEAYNPMLIKGLTIHPENPFQFDFIVDSGDEHLEQDALNRVSGKLINYFLTALTIPEDQLWVNLSPYEQSRIIPKELSVTEMGRDMLAQDYLLKQLTASLLYPEGDVGKQFWDRIYKKAYERYGRTDIPTNTFNKIWIVPEFAEVYIQDNTVFIVDSHLNVMLEEDYLALEEHNAEIEGDPDRMDDTTKEIIREIMIPEIEKEINEGKHFANLRQIYNSMILAAWYKKNLQQSVLGELYVDQNLVKGVDLVDSNTKNVIYHQYIASFKKGVFNYIKEDLDYSTQQPLPRKYFSGGMVGIDQAQIAELTELPISNSLLNNNTMYTVTADLTKVISKDESILSVRPFADLIGIHFKGVAVKSLTTLTITACLAGCVSVNEVSKSKDSNPDTPRKMLREATPQERIAHKILSEYVGHSSIEMNKVFRLRNLTNEFDEGSFRDRLKLFEMIFGQEQKLSAVAGNHDFLIEYLRRSAIGGFALWSGDGEDPTEDLTSHQMYQPIVTNHPILFDYEGNTAGKNKATLKSLIQTLVPQLAKYRSGANHFISEEGVRTLITLRLSVLAYYQNKVPTSAEHYHQMMMDALTKNLIYQNMDTNFTTADFSGEIEYGRELMELSVNNASLLSLIAHEQGHLFFTIANNEEAGNLTILEMLAEMSAYYIVDDVYGSDGISTYQNDMRVFTQKMKSLNDGLFSPYHYVARTQLAWMEEGLGEIDLEVLILTLAKINKEFEDNTLPEDVKNDLLSKSGFARSNGSGYFPNHFFAKYIITTYFNQLGWITESEAQSMFEKSTNVALVYFGIEKPAINKQENVSSSWKARFKSWWYRSSGIMTLVPKKVIQTLKQQALDIKNKDQIGVINKKSNLRLFPKPQIEDYPMLDNNVRFAEVDSKDPILRIDQAMTSSVLKAYRWDQSRPNLTRYNMDIFGDHSKSSSLMRLTIYAPAVKGSSRRKSTERFRGKVKLSQIRKMKQRLDAALNTSEAEFISQYEKEISNLVFDSAMTAETDSTIKSVIDRHLGETRVPGRIQIGQFQMVLTPWRKGKRMPAKPFASVQLPFDSNRFHYVQPSAESGLDWSFDESDIFWEGVLDGDQMALIRQKWPYALNHFLIVPDRLEQRPQFLDLQGIDLMTRLVAQQPMKNFRMTFNSLKAGASINHLHFHGFTINDDSSALENAPILELSNQNDVSINRVLGYAANGMFFQSANREALAETTFAYIQHLQNKDIAHTVVASEKGIYVLPVRGNFVTELGNTWTFYELMGFILKIHEEQDISGVTEEYIANQMRLVTIEETRFIQMYRDVFESKDQAMLNHDDVRNTVEDLYSRMSNNFNVTPGDLMFQNGDRMDLMERMFPLDSDGLRQAVETDIYSMAITDIPEEMRYFLRYKIVEEWLGIFSEESREIDHFIPHEDSYHISVVVPQDIAANGDEALGVLGRPHERLSVAQRKEIFDAFKKSVEGKPQVTLNPIGVRLGDEGALIFVFEYDPVLYEVRHDTNKAIQSSTATETGRPKPMVSITLSRTLTNPTITPGIKAKLKMFEQKYRTVTLDDMGLAEPYQVKGISYSHEKNWMYTNIDYSTQVDFKKDFAMFSELSIADRAVAFKLKILLNRISMSLKEGHPLYGRLTAQFELNQSQIFLDEKRILEIGKEIGFYVDSNALSHALNLQTLNEVYILTVGSKKYVIGNDKDQLIQEIDASAIIELLEEDDQSMLSAEKGGIDLNPNNMEWRNQNSTIQYNSSILHSTPYERIEGIKPVIIQITPLINLPMILGHTQEEDEKTVSDERLYSPIQRVEEDFLSAL